MSDRAWTDMIVGDRMQVDQEFNQRITDSQFSRQEWGLIMTAVDFEIENPADPDAARIVADTSKVDQVIPELENIRSQMNAMGGGGGGSKSSGGGGIFSSVKDALGLGGDGDGVDNEELAAANRLAQEYADELQSKLESSGKWERVRSAAQ